MDEQVKRLIPAWKLPGKSHARHIFMVMMGGRRDDRKLAKTKTLPAFMSIVFKILNYFDSRDFLMDDFDFYRSQFPQRYWLLYPTIAFS